VQAVFLRAVKSRRRFRGVENPVAYVFEIARNEAARAARRRGRRKEVALDVEGLEEAGAKPASDEEAEVVRVALLRLAAEDREIVELKVYGGLTFAEIGALVGRPAATIATRHRRALESLRAWLERQLR
jgi:RNA polymerase sigma-70 factor (ECF subfamily)